MHVWHVDLQRRTTTAYRDEQYVVHVAQSRESLGHDGEALETAADRFRHEQDDPSILRNAQDVACPRSIPWQEYLDVHSGRNDGDGKPPEQAAALRRGGKPPTRCDDVKTPAGYAVERRLLASPDLLRQIACPPGPEPWTGSTGLGVLATLSVVVAPAGKEAHVVQGPHKRRVPRHARKEGLVVDEIDHRMDVDDVAFR